MVKINLAHIPFTNYLLVNCFFSIVGIIFYGIEKSPVQFWKEAPIFMQTFLPYPSFETSAACLDYRRLGKQRVECKQILKAIHTDSGGWLSHPATKMWIGYEKALSVYYNFIVSEWEHNRGYKNNMPYLLVGKLFEFELPPWLGNEEFHASHRSNLLRKDKDFYGKYGWKESDNLPYIWPV